MDYFIYNLYRTKLRLKLIYGNNEKSHVPVSSQHPERERMPGGGGQPFAGAFSIDEIQSLEELDSERLSANWHIVLLRT